MSIERNIKWLEDNNLIVYEVMTGSQAYGTATPTSDVDIKGVFIQPLDDILGFGYVPQISDETNDKTYYEIQRFIELLHVNNPGVLEMLFSPVDVVLFKHAIFKPLLDDRMNFLTKKCKKSFSEYAIGQVKKASGLNKKMFNPMDKKRKDLLEFCYVPHEQGSIQVKTFLQNNELKQEFCGLSAIDHMRFTYGLYYDYVAHAEKYGKESSPVVFTWFIESEISNSKLDKFDEVKFEILGYNGLVNDEEKSNDITLSNVPKNATPLTFVQVNLDGYSSHCKKYKEYWDWVKNRNEARYADNMLHAGGYDGKNLAHCFRLLQVATEIAEGKGVIVRRENREELLSIRRGEYDYDAIMKKSTDLMDGMEKIYESSILPDDISFESLNKILIDMRKKRYFTEKAKN